MLGDAAHPMCVASQCYQSTLSVCRLPNQSQGAVQAIEDAACLGILFSDKYPQYSNDVAAGLRMYERIRKPRATRVQTASRLATELCQDGVEVEEAKALIREARARLDRVVVGEQGGPSG